MPRRPVVLAAALAATLGGGLLGTAVAAPVTAPAAPAAAPGGVTLLAGATPRTRPFPDNRFTVPDAAQATGRRIALPTAGCGAAGRSLCDDLALINRLDGFDLQPRVTLPFSGPVDLLSITPADVRIERSGGASAGGLVQLVFDPASNTVAGLTDALLAPATTYTLVISPGIKAVDGSPVDVCATGCAAGATSRRVPFTTMTSTSVLDAARRQLDGGGAYRRVGIPATQKVDLNVGAGGQRSVLAGVPAGDGAMGLGGITRNDQTSADPTQPLTSSGVIDTTTAAYKGFGSIQSPQYVDGDGVIANVPTRSAPRPVGAATIGVSVMSAAPALVGACLRPVIFGPGFTRSKYDLFLSNDTLATTGRSAVFATDPLGHAFGPRSSWVVKNATTTVTGSGFGRGHDLDGDRKITSSEGSGPSYTVNASGVPTTPSPNALVGLRDGLIQTVVDNMALVRALEQGVDVDGDGSIDTCQPTTADPHPVAYYGQSFGGIYGTMLLGTDPRVAVGVPNVPGGPIVDIARLSSFRGNIAAQLQANKPNLLNGGPGNNGFTESIPLRLDPRVTNPVAGAVAIQEYFARGTWLERPGSPETFAPALAATGRFAAKKVIFQTAYTDGTVPNPTANNIYRALGDYSRVWIFRNDRTPTVQRDPHGFLLDPTLAQRSMGQLQVADYITSGGATVTDPDGAGPLVEQASAGTTPYPAQLNCLHYPDPQTGQQQTRTPNSPDCADASRTVTASQQGPAGTLPEAPLPVLLPLLGLAGLGTLLARRRSRQ